MSKKVIRDEKMIKSASAENVFEAYKEEDLLKAKRIIFSGTSRGAGEEAGLILDQANISADRIIEKAQEEALSIKDNAKKSGYDEGLKSGFAEGLKQFRQATKNSLNNINKILNEAVNQKNRILEEAELEILKLALALASKVIQTELSVNPEIIMSSTKRALQKVVSDSKIKLKVSPHDYETLREHIDDLASKAGIISAVDIVQDNNVTAGGCIIETDSGRIDAQIETQFDGMRKSLIHDKS